MHSRNIGRLLFRIHVRTYPSRDAFPHHLERKIWISVNRFAAPRVPR